MKSVIFSSALSVALVLGAAVTGSPAQAQVPAGALGAIAHFNQDHDTQDQRVTIVPGRSVGLSTRSGLSLAQVHFNRDFDTQDDVRRVRGATIVSGGRHSPRVATILERIRLEGLEDE